MPVNLETSQGLLATYICFKLARRALKAGLGFSGGVRVGAGFN